MLVHVALLAALILSGRVNVDPAQIASAIRTFDVREVPPPEPPPPQIARPQPQPKQAPDPAGAASPPNLRSQATPVTAPPPVIRLPTPSPVAVADTPGTGAQATQGAAPVTGPGTGAGGTGNGNGAGGSGFGGGGGGGGIAIGPRQIAGRIDRRDYPPQLRDRRVPIERVVLQYRVGTDGFVRDCRILQSSGEPLLDQRTCQLYEQRYRYLPARDASGRPVEITIGAVRTWSTY